MPRPTHMFEFFCGRDGQQHVRIKHRNGNILMSSEGYTRVRSPRKMVQRLVDAIQTNQFALKPPCTCEKHS